MFLLVEFLIVIILIFVLVALYIEERKIKHQNIPTGKMTGYWGNEERRRSIRVEKVLSVKYMIEKKPHLLLNGRTKNISGGGILLETCEKLLVETLLGLQIEIPVCQKAISADGKVVWVKDSSSLDGASKRTFNAGIKFINMVPKEKEVFLEYVKGLTS